MDSTDLTHLERCVELAEQAVASGDEPYGSVLVDGSGTVRFEDHNHEGSGDLTAHPELAIAQWATTRLTPEERAASTVYTSGEHCPMCAAAHGWVGLGRIVFAVSGEQFAGWRAELGRAGSPVAPLSLRDVVPGVEAEGPVDELGPRVRALYERYVAEHP